MASTEDFRTALQGMRGLSQLNAQLRGTYGIADADDVNSSQLSVRDRSNLHAQLQAVVQHLRLHCTDTAGARQFAFLCTSFILVHMGWIFTSRYVRGWNSFTNSIRGEVLAADVATMPGTHITHSDFADFIRNSTLTDAEILQFKIRL